MVTMSVSEFKTVLSYDEHVSLLIELGHPDEEARMIVTRVREENGLADGQPLVIDYAAVAAAGASDITDDIPDIVPARAVPSQTRTYMDPRTGMWIHQFL